MLQISSIASVIVTRFDLLNVFTSLGSGLPYERPFAFVGHKSRDTKAHSKDHSNLGKDT